MKKTITEGQAIILIDEAEVVSREQEAFYNPKMKLNRDFSIAIIQAIGNKELHIGLPLAGTGVRAVRMMQEIPEYIKQLYVNDLNKDAVKFIEKNFKLNKIEIKNKILITNLEGNKFITDSYGFDYIDIDPFGSPNFLLDSAIRNISRKGIIGVSATDTGALAGTYPKTCKRKYFATSVICPQKHEIGIRILIRKIQLMGMHNDRYLEPIFTYHYEHYYRIFFRVHKSKDKATKAFDEINSYHHHCNKCSYQFIDENKNYECPKCKNKITPAGPLYSGKLNDEKIIKKLLKDDKIPKEGQTILNRINEELPLQHIVGSYDVHNVCYTHKCRLKSMDEIKTKLDLKGYKTVICATKRTAIKTEAPYKEIIKTLTK